MTGLLPHTNAGILDFNELCLAKTRERQHGPHARDNSPPSCAQKFSG